MVIAIIDYGMGNIHSLRGILQFLGEECVLTRDSGVIDRADRLILPGVGSFRAAMENLHHYDLVKTLHQQVCRGKPILGICLGMQLLGQGSSEDGETEGLKLIDGRVDRFASEGLKQAQKVPHVGFNELECVGNSMLLAGLPESPNFYFTHSYRMQCTDASVVSSYCQNGETFVASFEKGGVLVHNSIPS